MDGFMASHSFDARWTIQQVFKIKTSNRRTSKFEEEEWSWSIADRITLVKGHFLIRKAFYPLEDVQNPPWNVLMSLRSPRLEEQTFVELLTIRGNLTSQNRSKEIRVNFLVGNRLGKLIYVNSPAHYRLGPPWVLRFRRPLSMDWFFGRGNPTITTYQPEERDQKSAGSLAKKGGSGRRFRRSHNSVGPFSDLATNNIWMTPCRNKITTRGIYPILWISPSLI